MITCSISIKRYLLYKFVNEYNQEILLRVILLKAYNSYNFCANSKLFADLKLPVYWLLCSWYSDLKS